MPLALALLCGACDLWPRYNALDPARCNPRCSGGQVCVEGQCVSPDGGVDLSLDLGLDALVDDQAADTASDQAADQPAPDQLAPDQLAPDQGPPCAKTKCGSLCVDTQTSGDHCGKCDHSCGGGACAAGVCQPVSIATKLDVPFGVTVSGNAVFWARLNRLSRCPKTGCTGAPTKLTDEVAPPTLPAGPYGSLMVADGKNVFWLNKGTAGSYNMVKRCAVAGCTTTSATILANPYQDMRQLVRDSTNLYWLVKYGGVYKLALSAGPGSGKYVSGSGADQEYGLALNATHLFVASTLIPASGGGAYACALTGCSGAKTILFTPAKLVAAHGTTLYGTSSDKVVSCAAAGCGGSPKVLASGQLDVTAILADAQGVYWAVRGSGTAADGFICMCSLPSCTGGVRSLATGQAAPVGLALDTDFIYWVNTGLTGKADTGSVLRVRR